ncbi:MAG TPA: VIT1/CCC1 transporter family protein [Fibrobacteraceae bacterium]|nr:VIT1/CCC1 transporter family protein [Fibrobacteraceae bacterium]
MSCGTEFTKDVENSYYSHMTEKSALDPRHQRLALAVQENEINEYHIYLRLAEQTKNPGNAEVLRKIAEQELGHARFWQAITKVDARPSSWKVARVAFFAKLLGLTFVLKQMERREGTGSNRYDELSEIFPETKRLSEDERRHEQEILNMLDEEKLKYVGSIVLGLNDALVELTGALAGFTLALGNTRVITLAGLVTGISAAFSMAASDYLSSKAEGDSTAKKSAIYTGVAYLITVMLLILPFLLVAQKFIALSMTLTTAVLIIFCFNYYISVAKDLNFKHRFLEMTSISLGVATFSFFVGYVLKGVLGVDL